MSSARNRPVVLCGLLFADGASRVGWVSAAALGGEGLFIRCHPSGGLAPLSSSSGNRKRDVCRMNCRDSCWLAPCFCASAVDGWWAFLRPVCSCHVSTMAACTWPQARLGSSHAVTSFPWPKPPRRGPLLRVPMMKLLLMLHLAEYAMRRLITLES